MSRIKGLTITFWRKWHRWIGVVAALFLLWASGTGFLVAFTEFFGEEEALRERTRDLISPVTLVSPNAAWMNPLIKVFAAAASAVGPAPVDKVEIQFKGDQPTVTVFTGKPTGGEDRKLTFDARSGALLNSEGYADKPLLYRLHSGEAFGDGGLVVAMLWAVALLVLNVSGLIIYIMLRRPNATGLRRIFW